MRQFVGLRGAGEQDGVEALQLGGDGERGVAGDDAAEQVDAARGHLAGELDGAVRVGVGVAFDDLQHAAEDAAGGVDLVGGDLGAVEDWASEHLIVAGERGDAADADRLAACGWLGPGGGDEAGCEQTCRTADEGASWCWHCWLRLEGFVLMGL